MKTLLKLSLVFVFVVGCGTKDINVTLETAGSIYLEFLDNDQSLDNIEIRVSRNGYNFFSSGNVFEGTTDENGAIEIGPLNEGQYFFRIDVGSRGVLVESFEIIGGNNISRTFDINDYSSSATFPISNFNNAIQSSNIAFYLIPSGVSVNDGNKTEAQSLGVLGTIQNENIVFSDVFAGTYYLYAFNSNEYINISTGFSPVYINRDFSYERDINIPASIYLSSSSWNIVSTTLYGSSVSNVINSIDFTISEITFNLSGSTFTSVYSAYEYSNSTDIYLNDSYPNLIGFEYISYIQINDSGDLIVSYRDSDYNYYEATLR